MASDLPRSSTHPRLASLALNDAGSSSHSPRQHRQLGSIGGRSGPGYSPYARRVASRALASSNGDSQLEQAAVSSSTDNNQLDLSPTTTRQSNGLFGKVRSLPGRILGALTRSSSNTKLAHSTSLADVRKELDQQRQQQDDQPQSGMTRSKTADKLAGQHQKRLVSGGLPSSSSLSALSALASPSVPSHAQHRSAHSTLTLPHSASTTGSSSAGGPSFLTAANLGRHQRAVSPSGLSAASGNIRRSPSPLRTGLAGSMRAVNLASLAAGQPPSPTSASQMGAYRAPTLGNGVVSNPFGLTSRSPFAAPRRRGVSGVPTGGSPSARSVVSSAYGAGSAAGVAPNPLFPYSPAIPRAQTPSLALSNSRSMREGLTAYGQKRPRSPLAAGTEGRSEGGDAEMAGGAGGAERARKKQMVWDPVRGLVSRERMEREAERDAPPLPKNEAERILEVLEGMGRTPLSEAKRGAVRPKVNVPVPSTSSTLPRSSRSALPSAPLTSTPYAARPARSSTEPDAALASAAPEKGLQAVLRAREARRRALVEQEREEREREQAEDARREKERARKRDKRRREMRDLMSDEDEVEELDARALVGEDDMFSPAEEEDEVLSPRRVTRSSAKSTKAANGKSTAAPASSAKSGKDRLEPPTPRRSTRASSRTATKSPSPAPPPAKKGKRAAASDAEQDDERDERMASKSPAPDSATKKASPPPPASSSSAVPPVPAMPKITFPAPSSFPASSSSLPSGRSSLRPGKSHSSRQHQSSSKVFSAREEDLPPVDDEALGKVGLAFKVPQGFSFGAPPAAPAAGAAKKDDSAPAGASLLGRLGAAPTAAEAAKPAFSFAPVAADEKDEEKKAEPAKPAFSFAAPEKKDDKPAPAPAPAFNADFFSKPADKTASTDKPAFSFASTDSSSSASTKPAFAFAAPSSAPGATGDKPSFFGSVLASAPSSTPAAPAPAPAFAFGAPAPKKDEVVKPTEVVTPSEEKEKDKAVVPAPSLAAVPAAAAANPFAAFGKPVSQILSEAGKGGEAEKKMEEKNEQPKVAFSFGAPAAVAENKEEKKDTPAPLFSFNASKPAESTSTSTPAPAFSFGAPAAKPVAAAADKPSSTPSFSFGTPSSTAATSAAPTFTFGTTPATPKADEEKEKKTATSTPAVPLFGLSAPKPPSVVDDAGDSGMEDEADPEPVASKAAPSVTPSFTFGAASPAPASPFGAPAGGASPFAFGAPAAPEKKDAAPVFGGTSSSSGPRFGAAPAASKPAFTFGASPSPSPAPPTPTGTAPSFSFGQSTSTAPTGASPFVFGGGSTSSSAPAPAFGAGSAPASPAVPSFSFGAPSGAATPTAAPGSPAAFNFNAPTSTAMGQTLSAPSAGSTPAPSFSFGSQPPTPAAGGAPSFTFGGTSSTTTGAVGGPSGAAPFTFGGGAASPAPTPGGFSFGTASQQPTPGGGAAPGLFNMGSGGGETSNGAGGRQIRPLRKPRR